MLSACFTASARVLLFYMSVLIKVKNEIKKKCNSRSLLNIILTFILLFIRDVRKVKRIGTYQSSVAIFNFCYTVINLYFCTP